MIFLHIASPSRTDFGGLSLPKASSVSSVKLNQSAFLKLMNELLEELTTSTSQYSVVMIAKWSEPSALSVFQLVFITRLGLQCDVGRAFTSAGDAGVAFLIKHNVT